MVISVLILLWNRKPSQGGTYIKVGEGPSNFSKVLSNYPAKHGIHPGENTGVNGWVKPGLVFLGMASVKMTACYGSNYLQVPLLKTNKCRIVIKKPPLDPNGSSPSLKNASLWRLLPGSSPRGGLPVACSLVRPENRPPSIPSPAVSPRCRVASDRHP